MFKALLFSRKGLAFLLVIGVTAIALSNMVFKYARVDLTEGKIYTISDGTKNILKQLESPITLNYFFSETQSNQLPQLRVYAQRIYELLEEYSRLGGHNILLRKVDPIPFSEAEDEASLLGLKAVPIGKGQSIYLGLAATNNQKAKEVIEFLHPNKEASLEYELSRMIYRLSQETPPKVGIISSLPINGGFNTQQLRASPKWVSIRQIEQLAEVVDLDENTSKIPDDISVLLLVHPNGLTESTLYAIDQFVLRGGRTVVFVDPVVEQGQAQNLTGGGYERSSKLEKLFSAWGVSFDNEKVLLDYEYAEIVQGSNYEELQHIGVQSFPTTSFKSDEVFLQNLEKLTFSSTGHIAPLENATTQFTPLIKSSEKAMLTSPDRFQFLFDPRQLFEGFEPTGEQYTVAARLHGKVKSAFDKKPPQEKSGGDDKEEKAPEEKRKHLAQSTKEINVYVIADTDFLSDATWVKVFDFFGQSMAQPFADNGNFLTNLVDYSLGSTDLMNIRSRGKYARPFTYVEKLRKQANQKFKDKEKELEARLAETEQKLSELQSQKLKQPSEEEGDEVLELNSEQQAAIEEFNKEMLEIRKKLRSVKLEMDKDIRQLGSILKAINIGGVPLILTLFVLGAYFLGQRKRQKK